MQESKGASILRDARSIMIDFGETVAQCFWYRQHMFRSQEHVDSDEIRVEKRKGQDNTSLAQEKVEDGVARTLNAALQL